MLYSADMCRADKVHMEPPVKKCEWCGVSAPLTCANCNDAFYCGREHQRAHWTAAHKASCKPYRVVTSEATGRYLVSSRPLPAGALVLKEAPFALGPRATSPLVCLGCHVPIIEAAFPRCPQCHWPLCSPECATSPAHAPECPVLKQDAKRCGVPLGHGETPRYDLVLVLRCLLLGERPSESAILRGMESHATRRKEEAEPHHVAAVRYLTEVCRGPWDADAVHHARGAVITNSVNTRGAAGVTMRGMYASVSLLNHSCCPNVTLRSDRSHTLFVRTAVAVPKGAPLVFSYVPPTEPSWQRQAHLTSIYYFSCRCQRCLDPTELGTFFSCPKCPECAEGHLTPRCPGDAESWACETCLAQRPLAVVRTLSQDVLERATGKKLTAKHLRLFLKGVKDLSHERHFAYLEALQRVISFLKGDQTADGARLLRQAWRETIAILNSLEPGLTRRRGISLLELSEVLLSQHSKEFSRSTSDPGRLKVILQEVKVILEEASLILDLEPEGSTEERWRDLARKRSIQVKEQLQQGM